MSPTIRRRPSHTPLAEARTPNHRRNALLVAGAALSLSIAGCVATPADTDPAMPSTPGFAASGTATTGGVSVTGSEIAMGAVPLNVTVTPTWTLTNTGTSTVVLGEPHASVNEGCCPGPLTLDQIELVPGASTTLTFPLQMHPGMDGPHDFDIHIPVDGPDTVLTLGVTGTFG